MAVSTPRGIKYPTSEDKIKDGTSPSALADDFAEAALSADSAITAGVQEAKDDATTKYGGLPQRVTNVENKNAQQDSTIADIRMDRGTVAPGTNWNNVIKLGLHYTGGGDAPLGQTNLAVKLASGVLVLPGLGPYVVTQIQMPSVASDQGIYTRSKTSSTSWSPWKKLLAQGDALATGTAPANTNFDTYLTPGMVYTGGAGTIETQTGLAEQVPSTVWIGGGGSVFNATQIQIPTNSSQVRFWVRARANSTSWTAWTDLAAGGSGGGGAPSGEAVNWTATPASHEMRVRAFKDAYPLVSTGDKGVVCFRFDHGLTNFKSVLLPLFQANGITPYIAMNSRNWGDAENSGATIAEAAAWASVEWGNHTADHRDRNTAEGIYDNIVNGRKELEAQLGRMIHGFTVPGLSEYNKFEGFAAGNLDNYSETLAGGLILANHAICSGAMGNQRRPLDGQIRQGGRHYTWESSAWTTIKAQIDAAASTKTALTLMCHPSTMNLSGYWTPALAQQVIEYVKSMIDAGMLANISYYQSHHATL